MIGFVVKQCKGRLASRLCDGSRKNTAEAAAERSQCRSLARKGVLRIVVAEERVGLPGLLAGLAAQFAGGEQADACDEHHGARKTDGGHRVACKQDGTMQPKQGGGARAADASAPRRSQVQRVRGTTRTSPVK